MEVLVIESIAAVALAIGVLLAGAYTYRDQWGFARRVHRPRGEGPYRAGELSSYRPAGVPSRVLATAALSVLWAPVVLLASVVSVPATLGLWSSPDAELGWLNWIAAVLGLAGSMIGFLHGIAGLVLVDRDLSDVSLGFSRVARVYYALMIAVWLGCVPSLEEVALFLAAYALLGFGIASTLASAARAAIAHVSVEPS
jgi:hypothetical protein